MMTSLESQLSVHPDFARSLHNQLAQALGEMKQKLRSGGSPQQYQQWQQEANAIEAGIMILEQIREA